MTNERFVVTNHQYFNTGGNTMVSVFAVYDHEDNITRWCTCNEEGFNWQTADTITNPDFHMDSDELMNKVLICSCTWDALTTEPCWDQRQFSEEEWQLFKYCQFEFYKEDCKYFGTKVRLPVEWLPNDLFKELTEDYIRWEKEEGCGCLTDGHHVYMDAGYEPPVVYELEDPKRERELSDLAEFSRWLKQLNYDPISYGSYITVAIAGNSVKIPLHADSYDELDTFIDKVIKSF